MMRIKEAIQRRRLIQEMNDDWNAYEEEIAETPYPLETPYQKSVFTENRSTPSVPCEDDEESTNSTISELALQQFAQNLSARMNTLQVFEKMVERCPDVMPIFYRSAFLSCVEDKRLSRRSPHTRRSIATIRDHAHLLVDFIDDILCAMFDTPLQRTPLDPDSIARIHLPLEPLGFRKGLWDLFGEILAEVMFSQECVRAYPHAARAWSMLSVALSDSFHASSKKPKIPTSFQDNNGNASGSSSRLQLNKHRPSSEYSLQSEPSSCSTGAAIANMPNVALAACITGSCMSAVASLASRRRSIPSERQNCNSSPTCSSNRQYNQPIRHGSSQSARQRAEMYHAGFRCPFNNDARVTSV